MTQSSLGSTRQRGRPVAGDPGLSDEVGHADTILGCDLEAGTLDRVVLWRGNGGPSPVHRHRATTTVLRARRRASAVTGRWPVLEAGARTCLV